MHSFNLKLNLNEKNKYSSRVMGKTIVKKRPTYVPDPTASGPKQQIKKSEKRKLKRDKLLENLSKTVADKKKEEGENDVEETATKSKKSKNELLKELKSSIPTLKGLAAATSEGFATKRGAKPLKSSKRERIMADEVKHFEAVAEHPEFRSNPLGIISEHLMNSVNLIREQEHQKKRKDNENRKRQRIEQKRREEEEKKEEEAKFSLNFVAEPLEKKKMKRAKRNTPKKTNKPSEEKKEEKVDKETRTTTEFSDPKKKKKKQKTTSEAMDVSTDKAEPSSTVKEEPVVEAKKVKIATKATQPPVKKQPTKKQ
ncbi:hypothetical protein PROFUN_03939 [Planoprotostelium fungivorum]|uniref:Uncharacterized protein n=1 Tax=Planoprotostelium fungivorum TaxID=1890364 RepID=A0A2P6MTT0_9EUKA|nr:hypothetical protein PROFUN_03939 [Planoprotostelium fungivorum]